MPAECWGCAVGIAPVGASPTELPLNPLGTCWECHVFGCRAHGERDAGSGKWVCYASLDKALAASAGLADPAPTTIVFADSREFEDRFGRLADATAEHRRYWRAGSGEARLGSYLGRANLRDIRWDLIGDALGVGAFLLARPPDARAMADAGVEPEAGDVLSPALLSVFREVSRN